LKGLNMKNDMAYKKAQQQPGHSERVFHYSAKLFKKKVGDGFGWFKTKGITFKHETPKTLSRNSLCACGSGKRYRKCCGTHLNLKCHCGGKTKAYTLGFKITGAIPECIICGTVAKPRKAVST